MEKDLKGKELGEGIVQRSNGTYQARFVDKFGNRRQKKSKKLQEERQWLADATYIDQHSDLDQASDMLVDAWFDYWISIKKQTVRPNTVRNYSERYERNIKRKAEIRAWRYKNATRNRYVKPVFINPHKSL